jgi:hypothetical protein
MNNDKPYVYTLEVAGFASAFRAMRLPLKSGDKSDSQLRYGFLNPDEYGELHNNFAYKIEYLNDQPSLLIGPKDLALAQKLVKAGNEHAKVMRGIVVWGEFNLPRYIWAELDTYMVGMLPLSSESSMHGEAKTLSGDDLVEYKENLKESFMQKRIRAFSYQALRNMYFQRKNHRLPIWREVIIPWIESLPLSKELITVNPWWQDKIDELEAKLKEAEN